MLEDDLASYAQAAVDAGAASSASGLQTVLEIQRDWILNQGAGFSENFDYSFGKYHTSQSGVLLTLSRHYFGYVVKAGRDGADVFQAMTRGISCRSAEAP
jgi:hypothetical protein